MVTSLIPHSFIPDYFTPVFRQRCQFQEIITGKEQGGGECKSTVDPYEIKCST